MKWQPSCKKGNTKWSYTGIVPHEDVFYKLFEFEKPKKPWKQKKIDMVDFENSIGDISASVSRTQLLPRVKHADFGSDQAWLTETDR